MPNYKTTPNKGIFCKISITFCTSNITPVYHRHKTPETLPQIVAFSHTTVARLFTLLLCNKDYVLFRAISIIYIYFPSVLTVYRVARVLTLSLLMKICL